MSFVVGDKPVLALEADLEEPVDPKWVQGRFRVWISGEPIGDWDDTATFRGILSWLRKFVNEPLDRWHDSLTGASAGDAFHTLMEPYRGAVPQQIPESSRFHVDHVGMSALENWRLLLIDDPRGQQRLLWQNEGAGEPVREATVPAGEFQRIGRLFLDEVNRRYGHLPAD